ncbi:hypothetical protein JCM8115_002475 [Rhodotorula mucilaginosa]
MALSAIESFWSATPSATPAAPAPAAATSAPPLAPFAGAAIVVTGAASGIGRAVALLLAERGARLALTDLDSDAGRAVCAEIRERYPSTDVVFATLDCTDEEAVGKLMRSFKRTFKRIDGLVNSAGIHIPTPEAHTVTIDVWSRTMDVNARGMFAFCKHFLSLVAHEQELEPPTATGGYSIVNVGGTTSLQGSASLSVERASKHAILGLSRSLAKEYAPEKVRVNVVAPGSIETPYLQSVLDSLGGEGEGTLLDAVPMRRYGRPEEVASAIVFLLSKEASYITGAVLPVDGGLSA